MQVTTELGGFTIAQYPDNVCTLVIIIICQNALEFRATFALRGDMGRNGTTTTITITSPGCIFIY